MTSSKAKPSAKPNYSVKFAATEADQSLLQSVQQALEDRALDFSDLCKQALKLMLGTEIPVSTTISTLAILEQQIMTLQLQIMRLEERSNSSQDIPEDLKQQLQAITERLTWLEQQAVSGGEVPEVDPVLSRLAPLLEDF
jgi:CII-binding regulator of phage lambda lysogenization HflD